jgi:hypothetical protein
MMKNEFRIGNLVDCDGVVFKVFGIDEFGLDVESGYEITYIEYDEIQRIKLTEKWLIRFGFKNDVVCNKWERSIDDRCCIVIYKDLSFAIGVPYEMAGTSLEIGYVHQLQNLWFALAGKELELKEL